MTRLLLMSSSRKGHLGYLEHAGKQFECLGVGDGDGFILIPFASVDLPYDDVEANIAAALARSGLSVRGVHRWADPAEAIRNASGIVVAGGNTFLLLKQIYEYGLFQPIRERVASGVPYIGWSAGANIACPTIRTTNDMAIVMPPSLEGFGFVPFQINPHFIAGKPEGYHLQDREEKLREFLLVNPGQSVVALPEGSALLCKDADGEVLGDGGAFHFTLDGVRTWPEGHHFRIEAVNPPPPG